MHEVYQPEFRNQKEAIKQIIANFRALEDAGVDQLILLQQSGNYRHEHICKSLELFAAEVLPQFKDREAKREQVKRDLLAPFIAAAQLNIKQPEPMKEVPPVAAYPLVWNNMGATDSARIAERRPGMTALWQMQVGGKRSKK